MHRSSSCNVTYYMSCRRVKGRVRFFNTHTGLTGTLLLTVGNKHYRGANAIVIGSVPILANSMLGFRRMVTGCGGILARVTHICGSTVGVVRCVRSGCCCRGTRVTLVSAGPHVGLTCNMTKLSVTVSSLSTVGCTAMATHQGSVNLARNFSVGNRFPYFNGSGSGMSRLNMSLICCFDRRLGGLPICGGTHPALSLLAVASGIVCNGGANTAPSKHTGNVTFTPKTGPVRKHSGGNTVTSLDSITGLHCHSSRSNVDGAFSVMPGSLKTSTRSHVRGLVAVVSNCFAGNTRRLGIGMLGHRVLRSTVRRPRGCPRLAVHMSNCTIGFVGLDHRRRLRILDHSFRRHFWLGVRD